MTIVVCIKCSDGVVVAADSMLSLGEMQHSGRKIHVLDSNQSFFAFAGDLSLAERFRAFAAAEMPSTYDDPIKLNHATNISRLTADSFKTTHLEPINQPLQAILVHRHANEIEACVYSHYLYPRYLDRDHYYAVIGSGTSAALPFLAFLLESLNSDGGPPNLTDGKLFAVWAVNYAIQRLSGGVGGRVNVTIAEKHENSIKVHELPDESVAELNEHINSAASYLKRWKNALGSDISEQPPKPDYS